MKKTLIYGIHAIDTAIRNDPGNIHQIWVDTRKRNERFQRLLMRINLETLPTIESIAS